MQNKKSVYMVIILLLIVLLGIIIIINIESKNKINRELTSLNKVQKNAIVTNIWVDEKSIDNLKKHDIKYLIIDVGNTDDNGKLLTPENEITEFLYFIDNYEKKNNYSFVLLPYSEITFYNNLNFSEENFIIDYKTLMYYGFDGIYVDIEPIKPEYREDFIKFFSNLKKEIPKDKILSIYAGSLNENPNTGQKSSDFSPVLSKPQQTEGFDNEWEWDYDFYKEIDKNADLIIVQGYDTDLNNEEDYKNYLKNQINEISSSDFKSIFLIGVPSHKFYPEKIDTALETYYNEIKNHPDSRIKGVAIFSEWTMDEGEWKIYDNFSHNYGTSLK